MSQSDIPLPDASVTGADVEADLGPDGTPLSAPSALEEPGVDEVAGERDDADEVARSFPEEGTDSDPASFLNP
ncbi:hypothetical protein [Cellulomonas endophytica]|uniref:hypothetical protein n=1 Tax=Cellulomonas endophytica TaxID=2494735 RepID=UPI00101099C6|nr:hypothetical protein [Cellulomonas endophytica]